MTGSRTQLACLPSANPRFATVTTEPQGCILKFQQRSFYKLWNTSLWLLRIYFCYKVLQKGWKLKKKKKMWTFLNSYVENMIINIQHLHIISRNMFNTYDNWQGNNCVMYLHLQVDLTHTALQILYHDYPKDRLSQQTLQNNNPWAISPLELWGTPSTQLCSQYL